ncbi:colicin E3/pyocin S6 family cytotoxin [Proteus vulgaris]|uniref:colicin E3/pyocin S6 family cytotoxin n=1 Tax=Proteus TaxID=583 RepID=UPI0032DAF2FC
MSVAPKLARVTGVGIAIEGLWPSSNIMSTQAEMALLNNYGILDRDIFDRNKARKVTTMPADIVTNQISDIGKKKSLSIHTQVMSALDKNTGKQRSIVSTGQAISIPIVKATATSTPNIYTAPIITGAKPVRISVSENKADKNKQVVINAKPNAGYYIPSSKLKTHHAIVDFGGKHEALYVSIIDVIDVNNEKQIVETEWAEWSTLHPLEAALLELEEAKKRLANIDKHYQAQVAVINKLKATPEGLALADPVKNPLVYSQNYKQKEALKNIEISLNNKRFLSILLKDGVKSYLGNVVNEAVKENIVTGWQILLFSALHNRLADQVLAMHTQIEDAKKKLAPILESRKKAEGKKKAAEDKLKAEQDKKRQGVKEKGHGYHEPPKTQDIKGLGELKESKPKTPKQGGAGKRARWLGDKGRKIYEWDYQHGEIEGYRASDGQHIGAFDPKTGKQLKPADPKRNIKKYL